MEKKSGRGYVPTAEATEGKNDKMLQHSLRRRFICAFQKRKEKKTQRWFVTASPPPQHLRPRHPFFYLYMSAE